MLHIFLTEIVWPILKLIMRCKTVNSLSSMLFIRHGEKEYRNGHSSEFPLDPGLTEEGKKAAYDKFYKLCDLLGPPNRIVCSPYLRTRETAEIAREAVNAWKQDKGKNWARDPEIIHERRIGEFLGNHMNCVMGRDVRPMTLLHDPVPPETLTSFRRRVSEFYYNHHGPGWYVTHGILIQTIAYYNNYSLEHPEPLGGVYITRTSFTRV
jgi:broad specificity phosphatase PhoE